jgi:hypothetical protein
MKNLSIFFLLLLTATTEGFSQQNHVLNGNFSQTIIDSTYNLPVPADWTLTGKAKTDDGSWIFNLDTTWLPPGADKAVKFSGEITEPFQLELKQTVSGLSKGLYRLSAEAAFSEPNVFFLYAETGGNVMTSYMLPSNSYESKILNYIPVSDGICTVGFTANSDGRDWFYISNFSLIRIGDIPSDSIVVSGSFESKFNRYHQGQIFEGIQTDTWNDTVWQNDRIHKQIILWCDQYALNLSYETGDLVKGTDTIPSKNIRLRFPTYVKGDSIPKDCWQQIDGRTPAKIADALSIDTISVISPTDPLKIWVTIDTPSDIPPGIYQGHINVRGTNDSVHKTFNIKLNVVDKRLPDVSDWSYRLDLWQFPFHLLDIKFSSVIPFSSEHFDLIKPYYELLADAGQYSITTYIKDGAFQEGKTMIKWTRRISGDWEFDYTDFDFFVSQMMLWGINKQINCFSLAGWQKNTIRYYDEETASFQVLEVPIGSIEFQNIWTIFLTDFKTHLIEEDWFSKTVLFMDEIRNDEINMVIDVIKSHDPTWKVALAGSWANYSAENSLDEYCIFFPNMPEGDFSNRVLTFYTSCSHLVPNNYVTLVNSPAEMKWMSWYALQSNMVGYSRWAYDYGTQTDPLDVQDNANTAGDSNMIYRSHDGTHPVSAIRFELLREGIQDYEKIKILNNSELNSLIEQFNAASGNNALEFIEEGDALLKRISIED